MSSPSPQRARPPGFIAQFLAVLERRLLLFLREPSGFLLQFALVLLFPALVILFAYQGLPAIQNLSMSGQGDVLRQLSEVAAFTEQAARVGGLVSGLAMFQVVLLTLMASNNSAREVAAERLIFEKEKLAGLRPLAYLGAKVLFVSLLVVVQSGMMAWWVKWVCDFPGDFQHQFFSLLLGNAAMSATCLAISAWSRTADQASLISVYLVGFQIPLSGAILALPEPLGTGVRPLIAAYWSWSGYVQTLKETRFYDLIRLMSETPLYPLELCWWVLGIHVAVGIFIAYCGIARTRWE